MTSAPVGLSQREADARRRRGEGNTAVSGSARGCARILRTNVGDRRPAVLVAVLVAALSGGLFVPWFTDYFGLTDAAEPVFQTVLPALLVWFCVLSAVYRFRLLDRALGLRDLTGTGASPR